jgi:hypothetical protein
LEPQRFTYPQTCGIFGDAMRRLRTLVLVCSFFPLAACGARSPLGTDDGLSPTAAGDVSHTAYCHPGDAPQVIARIAGPGPTSILVDATRAYTWSAPDGTVRATPLGGGDAEKLADSPDIDRPARLLSDRDSLYWSGDKRGLGDDEDGWVQTTPLASGGIQSFVDRLDPPLLLAVERGTLDMLTSRAVPGGYSHTFVRGAPRGAVTALMPPFSTEEALGRDMVAYDGAHLFFAQRGVLRSATVGGGTSTLATAERIGPVDTDGAHLAWVECAAGAARLVVADAMGAGRTEAYHFSRGCGSIGAFVRLSGTNAYLTDGTTLVRVSLTGEPPTVLFDNNAPSAFGPPPGGGLVYEGNPIDIAVDGACVYAPYGTTLLRIPR